MPPFCCSVLHIIRKRKKLHPLCVCSKRAFVTRGRVTFPSDNKLRTGVVPLSSAEETLGRRILEMCKRLVQICGCLEKDYFRWRSACSHLLGVPINTAVVQTPEVGNKSGTRPLLNLRRVKTQEISSQSKFCFALKCVRIRETRNTEFVASHRRKQFFLILTPGGEILLSAMENNMATARNI